MLVIRRGAEYLFKDIQISEEWEARKRHRYESISSIDRVNTRRSLDKSDTANKKTSNEVLFGAGDQT